MTTEATQTTEVPVNPQSPILDEPSTGSAVLDWLLDQLKSFALTLWDMFTDLLLFIVDIFMDLGMAVLDGFAYALELVDLSNYINGMPSEVQFIFDAVGLGAAVGIVMTAGAVRLFMQLIPFVRLGS